MVREREFQVVDVEVQAYEDDADGGVQAGAGGDGGVVFWGDVAAEGGICATDIGVGFGSEFGFDAGFAEDEDGAFGGGKGEDAGDVDCGAVGGAEDFLLWGEGWLLGVWNDGRMRRPGTGGMVIGEVRRQGVMDKTYHFRWDAHAVEFFLVVGAGFGAVVCDKDDLFAWTLQSTELIRSHE